MEKTVAIIGASTDRSKYGNKAVRAYKEAGWTVYPVNPNAGSVEGLTAYDSIEDVPGKVERVSMYLPPDVGMKLLDGIVKKSPGELFLNPGSEDNELTAAAREKGLEVREACSIVDIGMTPGMFPDS
jgi:hypothetical protein